MSNQPANSSVRPKVRTSFKVAKDEPDSQCEPLEKRRIFLDQNRTKKSIPLLSKECCLKINCIQYYEPPPSSADDPTAMAMWVVYCKKFERFLRIIVQLPYFRFWSTVAFNREIHEAVESYLSYAVRPYRAYLLPVDKEAKSILKNIHSLIFAFFTRILVNKESRQNFMSEEYHLELLFKNDILDMTKILDLLQLYGYGQSAEILKFLLKKILTRKFNHLKPEMELMIKEIREFFCKFNLEDQDLKDSLGCIIFNVIDVSFSLNKLIMIERQVANLCQEINMTEAVAGFYSKFFPNIENEMESLLRNGSINECLNRNFKSQICLAKASCLLYFHHCIQFVFVEPLISLTDDEKFQHFDSLINVLNNVLNEKKFCLDYFSRFPFEKEFEKLFQNRELNDQRSVGDALHYYKTSIEKLIEEQCKLSQKPKNPDVNFFQENLVERNVPESAPESGVTVKNDPETLSKEQFILEMFPDFGDGFVYKCLEYFDFNNERVIDAILVGNLPPELESLNRKLKKSDLINKPSNIAMGLENVNYATDARKFDPVTKTNYELTDIYIGKKDKISALDADKNVNKEKTIKLVEKMDLEEEMLKENIKNMIERGKLQREELGTREEFMGISLYDDEFDDTYANEEEFDIEPKNLEDTDDDSGDSDDGLENAESASQPAQSTSSAGATGSAGVTPSKFRTNEKYENCARYFRKQLYNRKNHQRGKRGGIVGGKPGSENVRPPAEHRMEQQQQQQANYHPTVLESVEKRSNNDDGGGGGRGNGGNRGNRGGHRERPGNSHTRQSSNNNFNTNRRNDGNQNRFRRA